MKKGLRRLLSTLLISTLVLTSAGTAFAGSSNTMEASDIRAAQDVTKTQTDPLGGNGKAAAKAVGDIPVTTINASTTSLEAGEVAFGIDDALTGSSNKGFAKQVSFPAKGTVVMGVNTEAYSSTGSNVYFGLYRDAGLTTPVEHSYAAPNSSGTLVIQVPAKGTYYVGVQSPINEYSINTEYYVMTRVGYANGSDRTLKLGQAVAVGQKSAQANYFKVTAANTGYLEVRTGSDVGNVTLCNSKKKALTGKTPTKYLPTYGVKKGTTYYVKVDSTYSSTRGYYNLTVTNKKVSEKSGSSKAKAVTLKKGAKKSGTIIAGDKTADWYKIKLTGKKAVKFTIKGATNGTIKADVYDGGRKMGTRSFPYYSGGMTVQSVGKWSKGTFYVKIYRGDAKSSGYYTISWK